MSRKVLEPPAEPLLPDGTRLGGWWHDAEERDRIVCDLCPRECQLKDGDRGFCFVRENRGGQMVLTTYGRSTGFCIDPIEKKPLNHFFPGTSVLSFGTAGCNLGCKFCQNHDISKAREVALLSKSATPDAIAAAAAACGCPSVAYTYNDPVIWAEYAIDTARACRDRGIRSVAVTAGYICPVARDDFFRFFDAANIDLKGFTEEFYQQLTLSHLQPVLDTLRWLKHETDVWFEITNLIIPQANDDPGELKRMCDWILEAIGPDHPLHFSAFHPDYRMLDRPPTPHETLIQAYEIARQAGLLFVYVGNVDDPHRHSTFCPSCQHLLIERNWYELGRYQMRGNCCGNCGTEIPGRFGDRPGDWGRRRARVDMSRFAAAEKKTESHAATISPSGHVPPNKQPRDANTNAENSMTEQQEKTPESTSTASIRAAAMGPTEPTDDKEQTVDSIPHALRQISDAEHRAIQAYASEVVAATVTERAISPAKLPATDRRLYGAYVSLKRGGRLRGCCGFIGRLTPITDAVTDAAQRTARDDPRFPPVSVTELPFLDLETWLLGPPQRMNKQGADRVHEVAIGTHGLQIALGDRRGLLLPGVATDHGLDPTGFLQQVCRKAGLPPHAWQDDAAELATFEGVSWRAPLTDGIHVNTTALPAGRPTAELQQLRQWVAENIVHAWQGSTPTYYLPTVADGMVQFAAVVVSDAHGNSLSSAFRCSLRPAVPMQATFFQLAQEVAQVLQRQQATLSPGWRVDVVMALGAALHGSVQQPDWSGFELGNRGVLTLQSRRLAFQYSPRQAPENLVGGTLSENDWARQGASELISLAVDSTAAPLSVTNVPQPVAGQDRRPAAQAGRFYPLQAAATQRQVADLFRDSDDPPPRQVAAAMVPHAGWQYSGRIAAAVLARIQVPDTVLVVGPKHTRFGVDFAIAPCDVWELPGSELLADRQLTEALAKAVPGWQLDAAAHAQEHAIEVELPLVAYRRPSVKVVGVALGPASWDQCQRFASGLAEVLRDRMDDVLLLISSDMNHFATDAENRQLDQIALAALATCDPQHAFQQIRDRRISMCGLVPATVVMATLQRLNRLHRAEQVAYGTSADATGDTSRVVGYAGMLFD